MSTIVTSALPYANGPLHLGHFVEYIQTDIYVRFLKMTGEDAVYICASDTHGTPIELKSKELEITPEKLIEGIHNEHSNTFKSFGVNFDIFYTTNSDENKYYANHIYNKIKKHGAILKKTIPGMFCEHDKRFLPDRYVKGTCPKCGAQDQYGDSCESCGATYDPAELKNAKCSLCGNKPIQKESEHLFFQLGKYTDFLNKWVNNSKALKGDIANFVKTWLKDGLKDWCISRDGPYFGFPIPNEKDKFFYVWLDAPVGYISSTAKYCKDNGLDFDNLWNNKENKIVHFIGKDIVYFHALFWPAMLNASGFKLPDKINVHGFLTINGEKMSKSRGTFITADSYLKALGKEFGPDYLRYYYASKLTNRTEDIDLNIEDFSTKVNTGLVNNFCNFHNRCFTFCEKHFDSTLGTLPDTHPLIDLAQETTKQVTQYYSNLEYNKAIEAINKLSDAGNKFFQDSAPWKKIKTDKNETLTDLTICINLVKIVGILLKPVLPNLTSKLEKQLSITDLKFTDATMDLENVKIEKVEKLIVPIEKKSTEVMIQKPKTQKENPEKKLISFKDFMNVDLRIATVISAETIKKTNKLLKLEIDIGNEKRTLVAGIAQHYKPEDIIGAQVVVVANLEPATIRGVKSQGMILAANNNDELIILKPEKNTKSGAKVA